MLDISDLVVTRPEKTAPVLDGIRLQARRGEKIAIVGSSGAGKTTLFRAIGGFIPVHSGSISVDGIQVNGLQGRSLREMRRRVAMISQQHDMVDRLAVFQNVMAGALGRWSTGRALRFLAWPRPAEMAEAAQALSRVGLEHKLLERTSDLSGGEHQRVAIARALVQRPMVLLADEPVASLDPVLSRQVLSLLCDLAREHEFALVCSLHQLELAHEYFDRVVRMEAGRIEPGDARLERSMEVGA